MGLSPGSDQFAWCLAEFNNDDACDRMRAPMKSYCNGWAGERGSIGGESDDTTAARLAMVLRQKGFSKCRDAGEDTVDRAICEAFTTSGPISVSRCSSRMGDLADDCKRAVEGVQAGVDAKRTGAGSASLAGLSTGASTGRSADDVTSAAAAENAKLLAQVNLGTILGTPKLKDSCTALVAMARSISLNITSDRGGELFRRIPTGPITCALEVRTDPRLPGKTVAHLIGQANSGAVDNLKNVFGRYKSTGTLERDLLGS